MLDIFVNLKYTLFIRINKKGLNVLHTLLTIFSGISDLALIVLIFAWGFDFARKDRTKANKHHYGIWTLTAMLATAVFMFLATK
jgi:hypothetical protein